MLTTISRYMTVNTSNATAVTDALARVQAFEDMTPTPVFNAAVNELIETIIALPAEDAYLVTDELRKTVQTLISDIQGCREADWARRIIESSDPQAVLAQFPYMENYNRIVSREIGLLEAGGLAVAPAHRMLVIGSGPLPITALQFYQRRGVVVDQSDIDASALELGRRVSRALALPGDYLLGAGATLTPDRHYDVIFVAALAGGSHEEKQAIVTNLLPYLTPGGRLLLRSSRGARSVIYPVVDAANLVGTRLLAEAHPSDIVINSSLVFERNEL